MNVIDTEERREDLLREVRLRMLGTGTAKEVGGRMSPTSKLVQRWATQSLALARTQRDFSKFSIVMRAISPITYQYTNTTSPSIT